MEPFNCGRWNCKVKPKILWDYNFQQKILWDNSFQAKADVKCSGNKYYSDVISHVTYSLHAGKKKLKKISRSYLLATFVCVFSVYISTCLRSYVNTPNKHKIEVKKTLSVDFMYEWKDGLSCSIQRPEENLQGIKIVTDKETSMLLILVV